MNKPHFADQTGFPPDTVYLAWQIGGNPKYRHETIIPKGCIEIIFNFSPDKITFRPAGSTEQSMPPCFISGINTIPFVLDHSSHHALFGLRLHPCAVQNLLAVPSGEFIDKTVDLTLIDPVFRALWHRLYPAGFEQRIRLVDQWIRDTYHAPRGLDKAIGGFLEAPIRDCTVAHLSEQLCSSRRNLTRKFRQLLGMCTEEALLYRKYLRSLELVHHTDRALTEIAYESNFYDQSHFIREFRRYAELTPTEYRKSRSPLCGHIYLG